MGRKRDSAVNQLARKLIHLSTQTETEVKTKQTLKHSSFSLGILEMI
jgi:hypothetical protein